MTEPIDISTDGKIYSGGLLIAKGGALVQPDGSVWVNGECVGHARDWVIEQPPTSTVFTVFTYLVRLVVFGWGVWFVVYMLLHYLLGVRI